MVEAEAVLLVYQDEAGTYCTHEDCGEIGDEPGPAGQDAVAVCPVAQEVGDGEEGKGGQHLVEP